MTILGCCISLNNEQFFLVVLEVVDMCHLLLNTHPHCVQECAVNVYATSNKSVFQIVRSYIHMLHP